MSASRFNICNHISYKFNTLPVPNLAMLFMACTTPPKWGVKNFGNKSVGKGQKILILGGDCIIGGHFFRGGGVI